MSEVTQTGVYYGFARVFPEKDGEKALTEEESQVHPMVMSLGLNPFYKNKNLTAVGHLLSLLSGTLTSLTRKSTSCFLSSATSTVTI